ncbi:TetR/AcrR family transcriptional regulator [Amycolatopsis thermoflava]|uniref:TetR/AcrR family transcriptional regulator n=1 Tax=Amycolatopsis thermoflava TaxID=84480 RepID=UPI00382DB48B
MATARREKRATERRNRDEEVLEAAIKLFYEKGYPASSIQDVADVVGVLKGSLYHYISSKEDLLFRILQQSHEQARAIMDEVSELDTSTLERLDEFLRRMYVWYLSNIERVSLYFNQGQYLTGERRTEMRAQGRDFRQYVRDLVAAAKEDGHLRADLDIKLAASFVLGALNSIPMWYRTSGTHSPDFIAREFAQMSLNALRPTPATNRQKRSAPAR